MTLETCFKKNPNFSDYPVYVDGNNIAYSRFHKFRKPRLADIIVLISHLVENIGFHKENIHCICDPSLKYYIDQPNEYQALVNENIILEAPTVADEMILGFSLKNEFCFIISNDRFREYLDQLPSKQWLEERRIPFMIINEQVCLSPNIKIKKILGKKSSISLKKIPSVGETTTLDILKRIEKSEGELNLF